MKRGDAVVCVPVFGARELFEQCLRSVVEHTPPGTHVLVADDASPDREIEAFTRRVAEEVAERLPVEYVRRAENLGFVGNMNAVFDDTAPADVVIVNSDTVVPAAWLERLRAAAYSDGLVATASTLSNHGTILTVPDIWDPQPTPPPGLSITETDARIARASPRLYPRIPTGVGHCLYIRRSALDLVGGFDDAFSPGYGEEVDFCQRCLARGLRHVAADDLYVFHRGAGSFGATRSARQLANEAELNRRYPYYAKAVHEAATSQSIPLARTLAAARLAIGELSVTIDGSSLGSTLTGTQVLALELAGALARRPGVRLRVTVPRALGDRAREILDGLGVERIWHDEVDDDTEPIGHRPPPLPGDHAARPAADAAARAPRSCSPSSTRSPTTTPPTSPTTPTGAATASSPGRRSRSPTASCSARRTRATTRWREDLVDEERARARAARHRPPGRRRRRASRSRPRASQGRPFLLCLGTDFLHKNHPFAFKLFERLREHHGFDGRLVLAGPNAASGTSAQEEAAWRAAHPAARHRRRRARRVHRGGEGVAVPRGRARALPDDVRGLRLHPVRGGRGGRAVAVGRPVLDGRPAALRARRDRAVGRRRERGQRRAADRGPRRARGARDRGARRERRLHLGPHGRAAARRLPRGRDRAAARPRPSRTSRCPTSRCRSSARAAT